MAVSDDFDTVPFPVSRRTIVAVGAASARRRRMIGLIEVDVTEARRRNEAARAAGRPSPSLTSFVVACAGKAVSEHPEVAAYRDLRGKIVTFHTADAAVSVEVVLEDRSFPLTHVLRDVGRRSPGDLDGELRAVKADPTRSPTLRLDRAARVFSRLPGFLRAAAFRLIYRLPHQQRRLAGTIGITSVGMFGRGGGWGIAFPVHALSIVVGGLAVRPGYHAGELQPREMLALTLSFDHDVVDGAPAARFTERLRRLLESADGLAEPAGPAPESADEGP
jgi:pyruvate/2-oxoglutarate dehydrogenase complex dihydrolipoamide acyltransferase (E2) component